MDDLDTKIDYYISEMFIKMKNSSNHVYEKHIALKAKINELPNINSNKEMHKKLR